MRTTIYGHIETLSGGWGWDKLLLDEHNEKVINTLPLNDIWPPVSREMFSICRNTEPLTGPFLEYYGIRVVHFGASLKGVENEWKEWRVKFESLLDNLIWLDATVHVKTEYQLLQTHSWSVNLSKYKGENTTGQIQLINRDCWEYEETIDWNDKP